MYTLTITTSAGAVSHTYPTLPLAVVEVDCVTHGALGGKGLADLYTEVQINGGAIRQISVYLVLLTKYAH